VVFAVYSLNVKKKKTNGNLWLLIASITICQGAGILGSVFTVPAISGWYVTLNKPSFNPPSWLFGPVWTLLYFLMGISLYLIWIRKGDLKWFWVQLFLNSLWSIIFFGLRSPGLALLEIIILWLAILVTIKTYLKTYRPAAYLLYPYLAWVSFASFLNFSIWLLN
jgi:tryptophan-rich sensory protein